ncbi:hypothetical protein INS49_015682 [Diaporthe citri]|uniref:uncharacterized protein n=1 Tax=Diaporthe citri TaxID=83186 RepID=UPI001C80D5A4|nr:uncharacterized protein INS49_015682 [Diaporthe citri]KAG6356295.1 hypothetical protein INS49_015682 [Diaporthe citri]
MDNGSFEVLVEERLLPNDDLEMSPPENSVFKPTTLKSSVRLTSATILLATIVSLEVTLRLSKSGQGLGDVPLNSKALSYLWTALPGLIFTLIRMYCSSVDFDTRSLVPLLHLARGSKFQSSLSLDLVNKHTFLLLYEELKTKSFEALASTLAVTLASFLTIFSTGLFTSAVVTRHGSTELIVARPIWYNTKGTAAKFGWSDHSLESAAIILASNVSYPSFTYEDLILPTLEVDRTFLSAHSNTSAIEFSTTLLAVRSSFAQCRIFNGSQIHGDSSEVLYVSALACNESVETVEVEAVLFGPDLIIKPSRPPIPHQSAASSVDAQGWFLPENDTTAYDPYDGLPRLSTNTGDSSFDTFYTLLTTSRYAIPLEMLGNKSHASTVAEAIKFHHRIIAAQSIANLYHVPENIRTRRDSTYKIVPGTNDTSSYNATSSVPSDRPRVVQNEFSTRVLQSLLVGALICLLANWYLIHLAGGCGVVPRSPNTIANVAALLADGNLIELSRSVDSQSLDLQTIRDHLGRDTVFRLGWYDISGREEKVYCIYADVGSRIVDSSQHVDESEEGATQDDARL